MFALRVAELPTFQYKPAPAPALISSPDAPLSIQEHANEFFIVECGWWVWQTLASPAPARGTAPVALHQTTKEADEPTSSGRRGGRRRRRAAPRPSPPPRSRLCLPAVHVRQGEPDPGGRRLVVTVGLCRPASQRGAPPAETESPCPRERRGINDLGPSSRSRQERGEGRGSCPWAGRSSETRPGGNRLFRDGAWGAGAGGLRGFRTSWPPAGPGWAPWRGRGSRGSKHQFSRV